MTWFSTLVEDAGSIPRVLSLKILEQNHSGLLHEQFKASSIYARMKPVSLDLVVTKMYQIKPYSCTNIFLRGGMILAIFAQSFSS